MAVLRFNHVGGKTNHKFKELITLSKGLEVMLAPRGERRRGQGAGITSL